MAKGKGGKQDAFLYHSNIILEVLARVIRQSKRYLNWKGKSKMNIFVEDVILYTESLRNRIKMKTRMSSTRLSDTKSIHKNQS